MTAEQQVDPRTAVFARQPDLTPPTEFLVDESEPFTVAHERIQLQLELWEAVRHYERESRRLDAVAAGMAARVEREAELDALEAARQDADAIRERAERRAAQVMADRRGRVQLWASQRGLAYVVQTSTDRHGDTHERHLLTAPNGHPDLAVPPWVTHRPLVHPNGQVIVQTVQGDSLEAVESWLGLPHDPSKPGTPRPAPEQARA